MKKKKTESSYNYIDVCHNSEILHQEKTIQKTYLSLFIVYIKTNKQNLNRQNGDNVIQWGSTEK